MDNKEIQSERNQIVVKHNDLIQKSRYSLTMQEQKIILYLISKIKPEDTDLHLYEFDIKEFCEICGIDETSGKNYSVLKETIINLKRKCFWVSIGNGIDATVSWIDKAIVNKRSGAIKIKLDNDMKPFLLELQRNFTRYELNCVLTMKSKYSIRLYELLKSYEFMTTRTFNLEQLKLLLSVEKYENYKDFRSRVLEPALREINLYSDIVVTYEAKKKGKKYDNIMFGIKEKNNVERFLNSRR